MKVLELFAGTRSIGKAFEERGHEVFSIDWDKCFEDIDLYFGFPCTDVSVAGRREGVKHSEHGDDETTRSGLFYEAIRIIKEMREATNGEYPKYALFENVPGLFSAHGGEDFREVLQEYIRVCEPAAVMPPVPKGGWSYFDCYIGDGWSLAYRTVDAQHWGVAQRRRRLYAVLSLTDERAGEILFKREGLRGYFAQGISPWKRTERYVEDCSGTETGKGRLSIQNAAGFKAGNGSKAYGIGYQEEIAPTLAASPSGTNQVPSVCYEEVQCWDARGNGDGNTVSTILVVEPRSVGINGDVATTLDASYYKGCGMRQGIEREVVFEPLNTTYYTMQGFGDYTECGVASGLKARDYKDATDLIVEETPIVLDRAFFNQGQNALYEPQTYDDGTCPTLVARGPAAVCTDYVVRRLTPTECARLQGMPDDWGDIDYKDDFSDEEYQFWLDVRNTHATINGKTVKNYTKEQMLKWYNKLHTDSAEYKLWGNGIALPNALYVMQGIADALNMK